MIEQLPNHIRLLGTIPLAGKEGKDSLISVRMTNLSPSQSVSIRSLFATNEILLIQEEENILLTFSNKKLREFLNTFSAEHTLSPVIAELNAVCRALSDENYLWRFRDRMLDLEGLPKIMGIVNVTPDSFSDGGDYYDAQKAIDHALRLADQGADLIDIGGESTRPGSEPVSLQEELDRVLPVIEGVRRRSDVPISIDTYKSRVAREALQAGADIVNDISGGQFDPDLLSVCAEYGAGIILMHIKGTPRTMQQNPVYEDVVEEILTFLYQAARNAVDAGIAPDRIVLDPGIGFGKRWFDNYDLINRLQEFRILGLPLLIGASRKSFLGKILNVEPKLRDEATIVANSLAVWNGARIVRVHNVEATKAALKIAEVFRLRLHNTDPEKIEDMVHA